MRLLFVIKSLALPGGGAERILVRVTGALAARGHEVTVLTLDGEEEDFYQIDAAVRRVRLKVESGSNRFRPLDLRHFSRVRRLAQALQPDVAIGFMYTAFLPMSVALVGTGVPLVGSERTSYGHYRTRPFLRLLLQACLPFLAKMTVSGEGVRQGFPRRVASRMLVVPNPVVSAEVIANATGPALKTLLAVGCLRPEKDHRTLVSAFSAIAGQFPDWRLRIVGAGPLRAQLEAQVAAAGLTHRVELAGATSLVEREYRAAQLFVLPSLYEGFPNCLAEALAHGLPAVGFADCAGTNELILPGTNGLLADGSCRTKGLASALSDLMSSPSLRAEFGRAAPATVEKYGIEEVTDAWERLLSSTTDARHGR